MKHFFFGLGVLHPRGLGVLHQMIGMWNHERITLLCCFQEVSIWNCNLKLQVQMLCFNNKNKLDQIWLHTHYCKTHAWGHNSEVWLAWWNLAHDHLLFQHLLLFYSSVQLQQFHKCKLGCNMLNLWNAFTMTELSYFQMHTTLNYRTFLFRTYFANKNIYCPYIIDACHMQVCKAHKDKQHALLLRWVLQPRELYWEYLSHQGLGTFYTILFTFSCLSPDSPDFIFPVNDVQTEVVAGSSF